MTFSIDDFCAAQQESDWSTLSEATQQFLASLELPTIHPFCNEATAPSSYPIEGIPMQGPLESRDHLETVWDTVLTLYAFASPSFVALGQLWLRLFAAAIAPMGISHAVWLLLMTPSSASSTSTSSSSACNQNFSRRRLRNSVSITTVLMLAASTVLMTDTFYVLEYGPVYGASLWLTSVLLAVLLCRRFKLRLASWCVLFFIVLSVHLVYDFHTGSLHFGDPIELTTVREGLYYDSSNPLIARAMKSWDPSLYTYSVEEGATAWMPTGDARTGLPFLLNQVSTSIKWIRLWLPVHDSIEDLTRQEGEDYLDVEEVIALDLAFPPTGHDTSKPVWLLLHGLNGGSQEEFVLDFTARRTEEGSTVIVMIARGLMDLPVRGWHIFHGARWTDAANAAKAVRKGLAPGQMLAGAGFSMGGIVIGNYVARSGKDCALDAAIMLSGGLDMRETLAVHRSRLLWQPLITVALRDVFIVGKWGERVRSRLSSKDRMKAVIRATSINEVDRLAVAPYHGFDDVYHYYSEMGALGDVRDEEYQYADGIPLHRRIHNVSIPFLVVHALDDPLTTWKTVAANEGNFHPEKLSKTGSGNLVLLLTKRGGHVGWPMGWNPNQNGWKWMNDVAMTFARQVFLAREQAETESVQTQEEFLPKAEQAIEEGKD